MLAAALASAGAQPQQAGQGGGMSAELAASLMAQMGQGGRKRLRVDEVRGHACGAAVVVVLGIDEAGQVYAAAGGRGAWACVRCCGSGGDAWLE